MINYFYFFFGLISIFLIFENFKFHPYQSLYFNGYLSKKKIEKFQVDAPSLSRSHALNFIYLKEKKKDLIYVANSSWTPLKNGKDILPSEHKKRFIFVAKILKELIIYIQIIFTNQMKSIIRTIRFQKNLKN